MPLILADVGAGVILKGYFNRAFPIASDSLSLRLYTEDVTIDDTNTASTFIEAVEGGYVAIELLRGAWTIDDSTNPPQAVYAVKTFTFTGPLTGNPIVYGFFVVDADGVLIWAEKLDEPFQPTENGDMLHITPVFQMSKGIPT